MKRNIKIAGFYPTFPINQRWQTVTNRKYRKYFTHDIAITYLKTEILESINREMSEILKLPSQAFYSGLRFLFAEVTYLSHLYWGLGKIKNGKKLVTRKSFEEYESERVVRFMQKFNILSPTPGLSYQVFRHGLAHTHHPVFFEKDGKTHEMYISNTAKLNTYGIFIPEFSIEVKSAISRFIEELEVESKNNRTNRLNKFFQGLTAAGHVKTKSELKKYAQSDLDKLKF